MTHFFELSEKTKAVITKTLFLLRVLSLWVNYLSQPHSYYLAAREGFQKHSLSIKGSFHLSQKSGVKVSTLLVFCLPQSAQDTSLQENWNLHLIENLLQLAHV